ncbi:MAG: alpha/beta hydrolase [Polyangiaceae bacterium]|nr:alpha/beta hydrolase [Polyangiaceae bacterium]
MPTLNRGDVATYYEEVGAGFPVLTFAPGGARSSVAFWDRAPFNPMRELAAHNRVVAMDQRNAGNSRAPVRSTDGWGEYAADHVALLDHLGIDRCHLLGMCIGGAFALRLAVAAPDRVAGAVLLQPIGFSGTNREAFHGIFDEWARELRAARPEVTPEALAGLRRNLYDGDFVFSISRDEVRRCAAPLLIMRGNDQYHPSSISEEIAHLAPHAELVESWKQGDDLARAIDRIRAFLRDDEAPAAR